MWCLLFSPCNYYWGERVFQVSKRMQEFFTQLCPCRICKKILIYFKEIRRIIDIAWYFSFSTFKSYEDTYVLPRRQRSQNIKIVIDHPCNDTVSRIKDRYTFQGVTFINSAIFCLVYYFVNICEISNSWHAK